MEVLVPYDSWSIEIGDLASEFPEVSFQFINDVDLPGFNVSRPTDHRLYDRRRAVGLQLSRGRIVALTEDHALPADDWIEQLRLAHKQPYAVIGGAIENSVEIPMNRALYYCDFGRYGRPFQSGEVSYVSDVNLAYKREALNLTRHLWRDFYHETTVNWALRSLGRKILLTDGPVVYQCRPRLRLRKAITERVEWGRVFAQTRVGLLSPPRRILFAAGTILLPSILFVRAFRNMYRQGQGVKAMLSTLPLIAVLVTSWSVGELAGYLSRGKEAKFALRNFLGARKSCS